MAQVSGLPINSFKAYSRYTLPVGGMVGVTARGKFKKTNEYITFGLSKMMPVAVLLIGTGTIAGIIKASTL